jgi:hypothetical protein
VSLRWHRRGEASRILEAHRFAYPALATQLDLADLEVRGPSSRSRPVPEAARLLDVSDASVVVSAIEPISGRGARVRCFNASSEPRRVSLRWLATDEARLWHAVDLADRPLAEPRMVAAGEALDLELPAWRIATWLVTAPDA